MHHPVRGEAAEHSGGPTPRALLVEDRRLVAEGLQAVLGAAGVATILVPDPTPATVDAALAATDPTVALVAVGTGTGQLTEDVIGRLHRHGLPVVLLTGGTDRIRLARCVAQGATAIADMSGDVATLVRVLLDPHDADGTLSRSDRDRFDAELRDHQAGTRRNLAPLDLLTPREQDVLRDLCSGLRVRDISNCHRVTPNTVRTQIKSILTKLQVRSQVQAVALAARRRWFGSTSPATDIPRRHPDG